MIPLWALFHFVRPAPSETVGVLLNEPVTCVHWCLEEWYLAVHIPGTKFFFLFQKDILCFYQAANETYWLVV